MKILAFSLRQAQREWRAGELRALAMALIVVAAALSAVSAFTERVSIALHANSHELLGADLVVRSRQLPAQDWSTEARRHNLDTATTIAFPSVVFAGQRSLLSQIKAVSPSYPLRGNLELADAPYAPSYRTDKTPPPGTVWVDARVITELETAIGATLELGDIEVRIDAILAFEPDRGNSVFNLAPRVLMNAGDLETAGLLGSGSRVNYRFLVAGTEAEVATFRNWLQPRLESGQYFQSLRDSQQQVDAALGRAERFLGLAALTALILAGVAVIIAVRQFVRRHLDNAAILKCLGAPQFSVISAFVLQLIWLALPALALGCAIGYSAQQLLIWSMGDLIPEQLPSPSWIPALSAMATGLLALIGYGLPPLLRLRNIPPMRVLNRSIGPPDIGHWLKYLPPILFSVALVLWQAGEIRLGIYLSAGIAFTVLLLAAAAWLLIRLLRRLAGASGSTSWRYGLANVAKHSGSTLLQITGLGLGLMVMFLLGAVQGDLLRSWRSSIPADTPNYFLINIQPDQTLAVDEYLKTYQARTQGLVPMAVGRLTAVNGKMPQAEDFTDPRAQARLRRTVNLSWSQALPAANSLASGRWWDEGDNDIAQVSLESSWAEAFGLVLGDQLTFAVAEEPITATLTNIRTVDWDSFQVNFFIMLSPNAVQEIPRTYIASVFFPPERFALIADLVRQFPNISVLDIGTILGRVRTIIERVSLTVQLVFGFTLLAGIAVLMAALNAGLSERIYEGAVLRTLGGSSRQLRSAVLAEFAILGGVAGLLATSAASAVGWVMAHQVFNIAYRYDPWLSASGTACAAVAIAVIGIWGSRSVFRTPPVQLLREES